MNESILNKSSLRYAGPITTACGTEGRWRVLEDDGSGGEMRNQEWQFPGSETTHEEQEARAAEPDTQIAGVNWSKLADGLNQVWDADLDYGLSGE